MTSAMTMMAAAGPPKKARSNSEGVAASANSRKPLDYDYSLERSASSDAQLPSSSHHSCDGDGDAAAGGGHHDHDDRDDDSFGHDDGYFSPVRAPTYQQQHRHHQHHHSLNTVKTQRPAQLSHRATSDDTSNARRLQTIESGISLADRATGPPRSPVRPPLHPSNYHGGSSSGGGSPLPPSMPNIIGSSMDRPEHNQRPADGRHPRDRLQSDQTTNSYYSVDAGKHGFITHQQHHRHTSSGGSSKFESDSVASSANGSLVFKYLPGQETPPAEYALPATILKVYGEDDLEAGNVTPGTNGEGGGNMGWHRAGSISAGSKSSIVYSPSTDDDEEEVKNKKAPMHCKDKRMVEDSSDFYKATSTASRGESCRDPSVPCMPRLPSNTSSKASSSTATKSSSNCNSAEDEDTSRRSIVLPYHERKRLMEQEQEERRRKRTAKLRSKINKLNERSPMLNQKDKNALGKAKGYGGTDSTNEGEGESNTNTTGWFGRLLSIATGKPSKEYNGIEDATKSFRERGEAFLKRTEKERMKLKEQSRMDELNNVTIPVAQQSFGNHSRARMSSMSNALDSIPSCDSEDVDEETCSSNEESGSSYYWEQHDQQQHQATAKVWTYGEPPTASTEPNESSALNDKGTKLSKHDRIMRRERLLQEEYEYRLRALKRENERMSRRFRVFVLVGVGVLFAGALSFALVVCVKMLMSI